MIRAVIFDVDGTLLNTERFAIEAWTEAAKAYNYAVAPELLLQTRGGGAPELWKVFIAGVGGPENFEKVKAERWRLAGQWLRERENALRPGVLATLQALRRRNIPVAAATLTFAENTKKHLTWTGIAQYFDAVVSGDQVARNKPAPDVYLAAADALGIAPAECMAVEDSTNGVTAALAAGMQVVQIPDLIPPVPEQAEKCLAILPRIDGILNLI